jgi:predicted LPLAT superfamily acyltransferase
VSKHWADLPERRGLAGLRLLFKVYRLLGYRFISLLLYPVSAVFLLTGRLQRQASQDYLARLQLVARQRGLPLPPLSSFRHFLRFAHAILDKLAGWQGDLKMGHQVDYAVDSPCRPVPDRRRGCLILGSHLGDIEVCRALSQQHADFRVHALVFNRHARGFNSLVQEINPDAGIHLVQVDSLGPETAILLKEKIDAGDWVAIVGDRIALETSQEQRTDRLVWSEFLGQPAPFPQGPFVLAALLRCPVYLMFALKPQQQLEIHCELFADPLELPRADRQQALQQTVDRYAARLEHYCLQSPLDWFNFYDFWALPDRTANDEKQQPSA